MVSPAKVAVITFLVVLFSFVIGKGTSKRSGTDVNLPPFEEGAHACSPESAADCVIDGYVGSKIIFEDESVRIWNFTLAPGEMTSMHRHDCDYHFVAVTPTELEVWVENGDRAFSFRAEGTLGFKVVGDELIQTASEKPIVAPRTHAARNIGTAVYYELLFESKTKCQFPLVTNPPLVTTSSTDEL
jgi:hypothetical protein